MAANSHQ